MEGPGILRQQLTSALATRVCTPELGGKDKTAESLNAAGVNERGILWRAREQWVLELARVVVGALVGVQLCCRSAGEHNGCSENGTHLEHGAGGFGSAIGEETEELARSSYDFQNLAVVPFYEVAEGKALFRKRKVIVHEPNSISTAANSDGTCSVS